MVAELHIATPGWRYADADEEVKGKPPIVTVFVVVPDAVANK